MVLPECIVSNEPLSCHLCSPPEKLFTGKGFGEELHKHHIRLFHLGAYKPFHCSECKEKFTIERFCTAHIVSAHGGAVDVKPIETQTAHLEVMTKLGMQNNFYASHGNTRMAQKMTQVVKDSCSNNTNQSDNDGVTFTVDHPLPQPISEEHSPATVTLVHCVICANMTGVPNPRPILQTPEGREQHAKVHSKIGGDYEEKYRRCFPTCMLE